MMISRIFLFVCVLSVATTTAMANVRCRDDGMGGTKCVGYNAQGEYVILRSRTNSLGVKTTQGRIGNRTINTRSRVASPTNNQIAPNAARPNMLLQPSVVSRGGSRGVQQYQPY